MIKLESAQNILGKHLFIYHTQYFYGSNAVNLI
jgi:hypothetical protein